MINVASPDEDNLRDPSDSDPRLVLGRLARERLTKHLRRAQRWIASRRIDPAIFSEEDAIQQAMIHLHRRLLSEGPLPIDPDTLHRRFLRTLKQVIIDENRRQHASKRGEGGG